MSYRLPFVLKIMCIQYLSTHKIKTGEYMYVCTGIKYTWKNNKKLIMYLKWGARWLRDKNRRQTYYYYLFLSFEVFSLCKT